MRLRTKLTPGPPLKFSEGLLFKKKGEKKMSYEKILEEEYEKKINEFDEEETLIVVSNNIELYHEDEVISF